jgi:hypothetical protein
MAVALGTMAAGAQYGARGKPPKEHIDPRVPWTTPVEGYPLKVRILTSKRIMDQGAQHTYGSGNVLGEPMVGFDFQAPCKILHNKDEDEFYQGKWKKQDKKIEILLLEPGTTIMDKCTVEVTPVAAPYTKENPPPPAVAPRLK